MVQHQDAEDKRLTANVFTRFLNLTPEDLLKDGKQVRETGEVDEGKPIPYAAGNGSWANIAKSFTFIERQ